jgi:hypothetical protein
MYKYLHKKYILRAHEFSTASTRLVPGSPVYSYLSVLIICVLPVRVILSINRAYTEMNRSMNNFLQMKVYHQMSQHNLNEISILKMFSYKWNNFLMIISIVWIMINLYSPFILN